MLNYVKDINK